MRRESSPKLKSAPQPDDDRAAWIERLKALQRKYTVPKRKTRMDHVLAETRQDRF